MFINCLETASLHPLSSDIYSEIKGYAFIPTNLNLSSSTTSNFHCNGFFLTFAVDVFYGFSSCHPTNFRFLAVCSGRFRDTLCVTSTAYLVFFCLQWIFHFLFPLHLGFCVNCSGQRGFDYRLSSTAKVLFTYLQWNNQSKQADFFQRNCPFLPFAVE